MFAAEIFKSKNQPFLMYTSISERLKQAGIAESKPEGEEKTKKNKSKKGKTYFTMSYSKKHIKKKIQNTMSKQKNLKHSSDKNIILPSKESFTPNNGYCSKISSIKNSSDFLGDWDGSEDGSEKETITASLHFIQDCRRYKKKIRTTSEGEELKNPEKNLKTTSSNPRSESQKLNAGDDGRNLNEGPVFLSVDEILRLHCNKNKTKSSLETETERVNTNENSNNKKEPTHVNRFYQQSSGDVAKIKATYLQSLISLIKCKKPKSKLKNNTPAIKPDVEEKKKMTGREFFEEKKKKMKESGDEYSRNTQVTGILNSQFKNKIPNFRSFTKSEQIQNFNDKNLNSYVNSEIKNKNLTLSKPGINGTRKKRKFKNEHLNNDTKEFIETALPSEVSKAAVVKELWRRKEHENSNNSLSSQSSITVPEPDDTPNLKNLESYKVLKNMVEKEIYNIIQAHKKKIEEVPKEKNNSNVENPVESGKIKNIYKKMIENSNEMSRLERSLIHVDPEKYDIISTEKQQKPETILKDLNVDNPYWETMKKDIKNSGTLATQINQNWTILNRLEQAFLALGTPNFPTKNTKTIYSSSTRRSTTGNQEPEDVSKASKKPLKGNEQVLKNDNKNFAKTLKCRIQQELAKRELQNTQLKKIENEKINTLKKNRESSARRKDSKTEKHQVNYDKISKEQENELKQKKKKPQTKPINSSKSKPKLNETTSILQTKKKENVPLRQPRLNTGKLSEQVPLKTNVQRINEILEENLERKSTFSIISATKASIGQPRKSRSCTKINKNPDKLLKTIIQQECNNLNKKDLKDETKLRSNSIDNKTVIKKAPHILPRKLAKNTVEEKLFPKNESPKNGEKRRDLKGNSENQIRVLKNQTKETKKPDEKVDVQVVRNEFNKITRNQKEQKNSSGLSKNPSKSGLVKDGSSCKITDHIEGNTSSNKNRERTLKKRSILSVSINQTCNQADEKLQQPQSTGNIQSPTMCASTKNILCNNSNEINAQQLTTVDAPCSNTSVKTYTKESQDIDPDSYMTVSNFYLDSSSSVTASSFALTPESSLQSNPTVIIDLKKSLRRESLWEQDLSHYHDIVKEIMSQYKRIDGLLKQSERLNQVSAKEYVKRLSREHNSNITNLREYRKKIISEYEALPIFEYKTQLQETTDGKFFTDDLKRTLSVVKDSKTYVDEDVKDHYPQVKKILNSTLYVEPEKLFRSTDLKLKPMEKKTSLQESFKSNIKRKLDMERRIRSFSNTNIVPELSYIKIPTSEVYSTNYSTSLSLTDYNEETESGQELETKAPAIENSPC